MKSDYLSSLREMRERILSGAEECPQTAGSLASAYAALERDRGTLEMEVRVTCNETLS